MSNKISEHEKKMIDMRLQMQHNQAQMEDCFKDLESWTQDIKIKEKKVLEDPNYLKSANKGLPPIRSLAPAKKKKVKKNGESKEKESKPTVKKLNSYDYRAWDKLDVDKLCDEVDEKEKSSSSDYTTDDEYEEEQKKVKANWEKERGNQFFKDNLLDDAINCYTRAIDLDPTNNIYPANRAMCLIKQEKYGAAEVDCSLSISLDPGYAKAYHRRATCRTFLKRYEEAKRDIESLLKLEPTNKVAQQELSKLEELIEGRKLVFPVSKKEEEKSKKPLRRIQIEEINDESSDKIEMQKNLVNLNQRIQLNSKEQALFDINNPSNEKNKLKEPKSEPEPAKRPLIIQEIDQISTNENLNKLNLTSTKKEETNLTESKPLNKAISEPVAVKSNKKQIPDAPSNGYQFRKDWQLLSGNLDDLATYFTKIPPTQYEKLFLNGLESDNLSKILSIFKNYFINDQDRDLLLHMECLSKAKRFQTQLMFLSDSDKKTICDLIEHLKSSKKYNLTEIQNLSNSYTF